MAKQVTVINKGGITYTTDLRTALFSGDHIISVPLKGETTLIYHVADDSLSDLFDTVSPEEDTFLDLLRFYLHLILAAKSKYSNTTEQNNQVMWLRNEFLACIEDYSG